MPPRASRMIGGASLVLAAMALLTRLWFAAHRAFDVDEFEHAHAAWSMGQGLLLYRDFFEHHTPALYLAFAPFLERLHPEVDADAAVRALVACRQVMWLLTVAAAALTYLLGSMRRDRTTGAVATLLLLTSVQFVDSMLEFRPDVPAVVGITGAVVCATIAVRRGLDRRRADVLWLLSGVAVGAALMFTQKVAFALFGLAVAAATTRRVRPFAALALGVALPATIIVAWFAAHGALDPLLHANVTVNARVNGERISPLPKLWSSVVRNPPLYLLGAAGAVRAMRSRRPGELPLMLTTASLAVGLVVIGKSWDHYYAYLLPLLAVFAASEALELIARFRQPLTAAVGALAIVVTLSIARSVGTYESNDAQAADIEYVMQHTTTSDPVLSGTVGAGVFRPHAWYYFFLVGPFATDQDYASLVADLESGAVRPRVVILDEWFLRRAPAVLVAYILSHYEPVRGDIYVLP